MPKKPSASTTQLRGKIVAHNISPKGEVEGVLIETARGLVQLNLPKHADDNAARGLKVGAKVDLEAEREDEDGEHPVYRATAGSDANGKVVRLNYARHGEVNGYHLDDGIFVHTKPDGAKRYKVKVGDQITAAGERRAGRDAVVLEATHVARATRRADK